MQNGKSGDYFFEFLKTCFIWYVGGPFVRYTWATRRTYRKVNERYALLCRYFYHDTLVTVAARP